MIQTDNPNFKQDFLTAVRGEQTLRILLLEDLQSDAALIQLQLRKVERDKEVKHTKNQAEFEQALKDFKPHLILSDYSLGQYTGMEALVHTKKINRYIPFIICTGSINEATAVACIKAGADDYVLKDALGRLSSAAENALDSKVNLIEKEEAIQNLQQSEENFRALAENAPDSIFRVDRSGTILYANRKTDETESGSMIGSKITDFVSQQYREELQNRLEQVFSDKLQQTLEIQGDINANNDPWYLCRMGPVLKDGEVASIVLIASNITKRKRAELELKELNEKLQHLTRHLENIRDEEKKKIAMEIHDQLGQELTGNKLGLFWIQQHLKTNGFEKADYDQVMEKITYLIDLTTQTIQTVRRIAHELRPVVLDDIGLIPALEWHVENYNSHHQTECHLEIEMGDYQFDKELATAIYRMTQEALTNINRHAKAKNAWVTFKETDQQIQLSIKDDGVGIDMDKALKSKSLGLFGIKERLKNWGGEIDIVGTPNEGTTINIFIRKDLINLDQL